MRRTIPWLFAACLVAFFSYYISRRVVAIADQPHWRPFTATIVERMYAGDATAPVHVENYISAVRGDGSQVKDFKRQVMPNGGWGDMRVISDLSARRRTTVDPSTESVTTYPYSDKAAARLATPPSACSSNANAPHATLLGYDTVMVQTALPGAPGETRELTQWLAPALNCFALKETMTFHQPDSASSRTTTEAVLVKVGEPSKSLFDIPAGYVERTPSQVFAERARRFPDEPPAAADATATRLDGIYQSHQKSQ
jgi:hypothetical protein